MSKPAHLPLAVWDHANAIRARLADHPTRSDTLELEALERLLAPETADLWRDLSELGIRDPPSWRALVDLFIGTAPGVGFQPDLQVELKAARVRQKKIADLAWQLAELLSEHLDHTEPLALSTPHPLADTQALLEAAGWSDLAMGQLQHWIKADMERSFRTVTPAELLYALAQAAEEREPAPMYPHQAHATKGYGKLVRSWAHGFDAAFTFAEVNIQPRGLQIGHETLARIARAVLAPYLGPNGDVTADMIRKSRKEAPSFQPTDYTVFY